MVTAQVRLQEIKAFVRRRWIVIVLPCVLVSIISTFGAYILPRKYESSTTILVRPDELLQPIQGYELSLAFEEQLRNFSEILYSRTVVLALADSLGYAANSKSEFEKMAIVNEVSGNINTTRLGSDSFRITYVDTNPSRAQRAAGVLADLFIQVKLSVTNKQNALAVQFYEQKVREYKEEYDQSVRSLVSAMKQNVADLPVETRSLYSGLDEVERLISTTDARLKTLQEASSILRSAPKFIRSNPGALRTEAGKEPLLRLIREDLPFVSQLRSLVDRYDSVARRFTDRFPEVANLQGQILAHLERMLGGVSTEIDRIQSQQSTMERRRSQLIEELKKSSTATRLNEDVQSTYEADRRQYEAMKSKLEQARLTQEVSSRGADQFIVLDPAYLPIVPTKPNRKLIVAGGIGLGLLLGVFSALAVELFDTTVRTPKDIQIYNKPIIALLPDGRER